MKLAKHPKTTGRVFRTRNAVVRIDVMVRYCHCPSLSLLLINFTIAIIVHSRIYCSFPLIFKKVFAYDDWVRHRSSNRFTGRFIKFGKSGIVRALLGELILTSSVASFVCLYNALFINGYSDLSGVHHDTILAQFLHLPVLSLPAMFFTLSSPALSLLLGTCLLHVASVVYSVLLFQIYEFFFS